jgi:GNAT superfamily N-acetyltransferase
VLSDLPYFYDICLKTGDAGNDASALFSDPYLVGHYFAAPYLLYPDGICFTAEYENRPQGYIVAVPDTAAFGRWLDECWLPPLRKRFPKRSERPYTKNEEDVVNLIHKQHYPPDKNYPQDTSDTIIQPWLVDYPAHLHIDLLPDIQRKGIGKILMNYLFDELKKQKVSGLHLGVALSNRSAVCFYQKMGFSVIEEQEWGYTMGKLFSKE